MSMTGNMELAVNNPFRYRGYYYDVESGLLVDKKHKIPIKSRR
jgi:hypothetical protein